MTSNVVPLHPRRAEALNRRLLEAARGALQVLDEMPLRDLAAGKDSTARAALASAIADVEREIGR